MTDSQHYRALGVSSGKDDVISAARMQGDGVFPGAFCKLVDDALTNDPETCLALHADGAGTKSIVAYLLFRETGDPTVFASLAQDALVMNVDDLLCVGATGPFVLTNTIGRHRGLVPGSAIEAIIGGYERSARILGERGVEILLCGGETADLGDLVRTVVVDSAVACRLRRDRVIDGRAVVPGDLIIGLASAGQADYEERPNSGIGSNGLTLARHVLLEAGYRERFPESSAPDLAETLAYRGPYALSDRPDGLAMTVGEALLSPTRSYSPVVVEVIERLGSSVHGIVHCTGGGQTKCLRFGAQVGFVKDDLFPIPPIFSLLRQAAGMEWEEMYRVFNMGHRMELFVDSAVAEAVIAIARSHGVDARIVGRCVPQDDGPRLRLHGPDGVVTYRGTASA